MAIERENKPVEEKNGMRITDNMDGEKRADEKLEMKSAAIPKGLTVTDAIKTFKMSLDRNPKNLQEVIDFFKDRKLNKALPKNLETTV